MVTRSRARLMRQIVGELSNSSNSNNNSPQTIELS
jgi:hypothetical protein